VTAFIKIQPPVIAHRGASAYAPENTMIAFAKARELGIKWLEFDVTLAQSGEPIIIHDDTLERTTNGLGNVVDYSYAHLQTLDAGSWFNKSFTAERIPTLKQVIQFLQESHMAANVELKEFPGHEEKLVTHVLEELAPHLKSFGTDILFSSFSVKELELLRQYAPECHMGLLLHEWVPGWQDICTSLNCASVHVYDDILTEKSAKQIKSMNKGLLCYTVNNPARAKQLFSWGVDAVFSDCPDRILHAL